MSVLKKLRRLDESDSSGLAKRCIQEAKADWGAGWQRLSEELRAGQIALKLLSVIASRSDSSPDVEKIHQIAMAALEGLDY